MSQDSYAPRDYHNKPIYPIVALVAGCCVLPLIVCAALAWIVFKSPEFAYRRHISVGNSYYESRMFSQAVDEYDGAIEAKPDDYFGYSLRAMARYMSRDYRGGITDNTKAIARARTSAALSAIYYNRGLDYQAIGNYRNAVADYIEALKRNPQDGNALLRRGECYRQLGNPAAAVADIDAYCKIGSPDYVTYYERGFDEMDLKRWKDSAEDFTHATKLRKDYDLAWCNLGWVQYLNGNLHEAIESDRTALRLRPGLTVARFNLALCYAQQNSVNAHMAYKMAILQAKPSELKSALEDIRDARKRFPGSSGLRTAQEDLELAQK